MGRIVSRPAGKAGQPHIRKIRGELRRPKGSRRSKAAGRNHFKKRRNRPEIDRRLSTDIDQREFRTSSMVEAVTLVLGLLSAVIFLAHAVEAYGR
jgi:hypothetical protein